MCLSTPATPRQLIGQRSAPRAYAPVRLAVAAALARRHPRPAGWGVTPSSGFILSQFHFENHDDFVPISCNVVLHNGAFPLRRWANDTDRPARWVAAAEEGRLFLHGFFKFLWSDHKTPITKVDVETRQLITNVSIGATYGISERPQLDLIPRCFQQQPMRVSVSMSLHCM